MYTLDGRQKKALHAALRNAFPRPAALERLVEFHLDEHLAVIAGEGALDDVIFRLIAWAEAQGRLAALVNGARAEAPGNPLLTAFERAVIEARDTSPLDVSLRKFAERVQLAPAVPDEPDLEKRVFRAGFSDIAQWRERLGHAELAVCRIESPAWRALGTGFLVGPDLVMTNRHVIDAFASQPSPPLVVRFDFKVSPDGSRLREGETFGVASDWLVASSPVADLDFAVLRLSAPAGLKPTGGTASAPPRGWITPQWREMEPDETIFVIQHPQGETLKLASGRYDSRDGTRLRYRVDTEPGSSGSPCFTAQMELVGLHRGSAEGLANQGVPFDALMGALPAGFFTAVRADPSPTVVTQESVVAVERLVPRGRRRAGLAAAGIAVAAALVAVPLWWTRDNVRPKAIASSTTTVVTKAVQPTPTRRPVEVLVPFSVQRVEGPRCQSDASHARALFRLATRGPWPASSGTRSRELQLVALDGIEIEGVNIATVAGAVPDAVAQAQPSRRVARKWQFGAPVTGSVVIVACVRSAPQSTPQPAFSLNTWQEVGSP